MTDRLSSETLHATAVARGGRCVLIVGPSGSGKSDLALRLIDRGFGLVSDDQVIVRRDRGRLVAAAPATIRGKFEVRGLGIVELPAVDDCAVALVVELAEAVERMPPDGRTRTIAGAEVPLVQVDPREASAAAKVALALDRFGLPL